MISNRGAGGRTTAIVITLHAATFRLLPIGRGEHDDCATLNYLRSARFPLLHGKPRSLLELAELDARTASPGPQIDAAAILVSGESLHEDDRSRLESWFRCRVYNAYIATEGGLIALECPLRTGLHIRRTLVRLEALDNWGDPRAEGSGELLLTNLANWGTAFVRYRTGDKGTIRHVSCRCGFEGPTLVEFPARDAQDFELANGRCATLDLNGVFVNLPFTAFQIIQRNHTHFTVRWSPAFEGLSKTIFADDI